MSVHVSVDEPLYTVEHKLALPSLTVYPISDVHIGARGHASREFQALLKHIGEQDESHRILLVGDLADVAIKDSASFSHGAVPPEDELEELVRLLDPLSARVDVCLPGNHERRTDKAAGLGFTAQLAARIGRPQVYRPTTTAIRYWFGRMERGGRLRTSCTLLAAHGWGGGRTPGAKLNKAASLSGLLADADVYLMGHVHEQITWTTTCTYGFPPKRKEQRIVVTGTHLGPEHYSLDYGYRGSAVGCPVIRLASDRKDQLKVRVEL